MDNQKHSKNDDTQEQNKKEESRKTRVNKKKAAIPKTTSTFAEGELF
jgi:hypothetical protein